MRYAPALAAVLITSVVLCGCPAPSPQAEPDPAPASESLRVGYFPNVTHAPAVLGFSAANRALAQALPEVRIETKTFNAGPEAMEALHTGALDLCFVGPTPAINAFARGGDVVLVANVANGGSVLVARAGTGIASVADLEGKKIAVPQLGNTQDALLRHLLRQAEIKLADQGGKTSVLGIANPDVLALFLRGELDAACVPEPWGARLEQQAQATVVLDEKAIWRGGDYPVTVLVARKPYLERHRETVRSFVAALDKLDREIAASPQAKAAALNAELKVLTNKEVKPEVLSRALERIAFTTTVSPEALQAMAQVMQEVGIAKTVPDVGGLTDTSLLPK